MRPQNRRHQPFFLARIKIAFVLAFLLQINMLYASESLVKDAERGDAVAQYNLGVMYSAGKGVQQDVAQAINWYRMAAEQGLAAAQHNLGVMYKEGKGVPRDYAQGKYWYRKAADGGNAQAQLNLGYMYHHGQGMPPNLVIACALYKIAGAQDVPNVSRLAGTLHTEVVKK